MLPMLPVLVPEDPGIDASKNEARHGDTVVYKLSYPSSARVGSTYYHINFRQRAI